MPNYLEEIKCPFYIRSDRKNRMICEGCVDGHFVHHDFKNALDYFKYKNYFCNSLEHYPFCPYAKIALEKYV